MSRLLAGIGLMLIGLFTWAQFAGEGRRGGAYEVSVAEPVTIASRVQSSGAPSGVSVERESARMQEAEGPDDTVLSDIAVFVKTGLGEKERPVPGIQVALGFGPRAHEPRFVDQPVLARGTSDHEGLVALRIAVPRERTLRKALIWTRVESPGYQQRAHSASVGRVLRDKQLELRAMEGGTLFGIVQDGSEDPVAWAEVALFGDGGARYGSAAESDALGRFALDHRGSGRMTVHARAAGQGSGTVALDPSHGAQTDDLTVVVRGSGVLAGRILDLGGQPIRGMRVTATPRGAEPRPSSVRVLEAEQDGGLWGAATTTDAEGGFRFYVLTPGSYFLNGPLVPRSSPVPLPPSVMRRIALTNQPSMLLSPSAFPTGTDDLVLRVGIHRIEVSVFTADGQPIDPGQAVDRGSSPASTSTMTPDAGPTLTCVPIETVRPEQYPLESGCTATGDVASFRVEAARDYVVTWADPAYPLQERRVSVTWETFRVSVRFDLPEPTGETSLKLHLMSPDGRPFEADNQIDVLSAQGGKLIASSRTSSWHGRQNHRGADYSTALPPGRYRVRVTTRPNLWCKIPYPRPRAPHAPVEFKLDVPPGRITVREVLLPASGWLEIEPIEPRKKPEASQDSGLEYLIEAQVAQRKRFDGQPVRLTSSADGTPYPVIFKTEALRARPAPWVVRGYAARSQAPIPVGRYELRIGGEDGPLFEQTIVIKEGTTTIVALGGY
jgi:hypothetical protein